MNDFARLIEAEIPRLRRYARALTRDVIRADDLVQSCLTRALAKQHLWQPGTNLRAWLFTLLHNQHVTLRDLETALGKLAPEQRQVILLAGLEGLAYEKVAEI